jgi:hypothetical protein
LAQALLAITDHEKQTHKIYITERTNEEQSDSCGSVRDEREDISLERFSPEELNEEQRFEYLKQEVDRAEKERSEAIMAAKPKKDRNLILIVAIFIAMLMLGNAVGKKIGLKTVRSPPIKQKREY